MKNKKGLSPLISWVLIISFAIAMAILVTKWVIDNVENVEFETENQFYCKDVSIYITNVCKTTANEIQISMRNNGNFRIDRLSIGLETTHKPESWCLKINVPVFNPSSDYTYSFPFGTMTGRLIGNETTIYQNCDEVIATSPESGEVINKIALVPWIRIEDKPVSCIDKKIELEQNVQDC